MEVGISVSKILDIGSREQRTRVLFELVGGAISESGAKEKAR